MSEEIGKKKSYQDKFSPEELAGIFGADSYEVLEATPGGSPLDLLALAAEVKKKTEKN